MSRLVDMCRRYDEMTWLLLLDVICFFIRDCYIAASYSEGLGHVSSAGGTAHYFPIAHHSVYPLYSLEDFHAT
jgi:hypothetical protein